MADLILDVRDPLVTKHVSVSGGSDGLYIYSKLVPQIGFNLTKVIDGFTTLWERNEDHLDSLTIHRLGNLPVVLLLQFSETSLYFEYKDFSWKKITKDIYNDKLHLDLHRHNFGSFAFDLKKRDLKDVVILSLHDDPYLTTHFKPELGKTCKLLKDGTQILWEAKTSQGTCQLPTTPNINGDVNTCDKCLEFSTHDLNGISKYLRLTALESGRLAQKFFENHYGVWIPISLNTYFDKRAPKNPQSGIIDLSTKEHPRVFFLQGKPLGLLYDVFFSSLLGKVVKVVDGDTLLWEAKRGERCLHVTLTHDGTHSHLLYMNYSGLKDLYFEKDAEGEWKVIANLPDKFKVISH